MIFLTNPIVLVRKRQLLKTNKLKMTHFHWFSKLVKILDFVSRESMWWAAQMKYLWIQNRIIIHQPFKTNRGPIYTNCNEFNIYYESMYLTHAIISRSLYILTPFSLLFFSIFRTFSLNSVLMPGYCSRAVL